ncbi:YXWGXW repeat-containing protein [Mucilaginibacter agri]|uniref:BcpO-related WXXGXW repeat protein n=1 Tax=Mucilaginibacter agri TaxID=2695265 RepID=A0A965ZLW1_9SPHI|nr:YXWGXW repeat-containing protein [Mucilaginibacter agri]NCD72017.1 BcpO-related WXXGXW repeat protein [Mucilaginibacter agri]
MKTAIKLILAAGIAGTLFSSCGSSSYYVTERPVEPVYVRPAPPYANAYWVPAEWAWRGNTYVYVNGYYTHPRQGHVYRQGYWRQSNRGQVWVHGSWR